MKDAVRPNEVTLVADALKRMRGANCVNLFRYLGDGLASGGFIPTPARWSDSGFRGQPVYVDLEHLAKRG